MKYIVSILILAGIMFMALLPANAQEQKSSEWTGKLANGRTITKEDLSKIIKEHKEWLSSEGKHGKRADLKEAYLVKANLYKANLYKANLSEAKLQYANLKEAYLGEANLYKANLYKANLSGAKLQYANLKEAYLGEANLHYADLKEASLVKAIMQDVDLSEAGLYKADLSGAHLYRAELSEAYLSGANLITANLIKANLSEADLSGARLYRAELRWTNFKGADASFTDFSNSFFEPENIEELLFLGAKGLSTIRFDDFKAVADLRKVAKESGLRTEERALTAALYKYRLKAAPPLERIIVLILLGMPTDYGANPWGSFYVLACFIVIFSFYYMNTLKRQGKDGIWKIWIPERVRKDLGKQKPTRLTLRGLAVLRVGLYFSVLSAFNIGWRELNVGNWIARIQRREYIYRATGWTRTISGIQSLLSVYLLALWALTYFGRPFE